MQDVTRSLVAVPSRPASRFTVPVLVKTLALLCVLTMAIRPALAADGRLASILIDVNNGRILESDNADLSRYPASLTKMMTLYLAFEALDNGRVSLDQPLTVSSRAAAQPPTKLGLRAGQTIPLETALLGLVTKSANDAAMVVAEDLAGTEEDFALRMTGKAHSLGMTQTVFRNASGLPDPNQTTTARDMATLALSLLHHYPQYYHYFSVKEFYYGGRPIANHNRLLGVYEGVDGIKTGYTRASGFNLVASAQQGDRRLIGVVLGAPSSRVRNAMMADLFDQAFRGDPQIQLASISYYLNGGSALASTDIAQEISDTRRHVAYAPAATMQAPRAVAKTKAKAKSTRTSRAVARSNAKSAKSSRVLAATSPRATAKKATKKKATTTKVVAASPARPKSSKAKTTLANSKPKPSAARPKAVKASTSTTVFSAAARKPRIGATNLARR